MSEPEHKRYLRVGGMDNILAHCNRQRRHHDLPFFDRAHNEVEDGKAGVVQAMKE